MGNNMVPKALQGFIESVKQRIDTAIYRENEQMVRRNICIPMLDRLGWDTHSEDYVISEYRVNTSWVDSKFKINKSRVDIALCHQPKEPAIFIEVKKLGGCSSDGLKQVFNYAHWQGGGIHMVILTDGNEWHFYNSDAGGDYESKRVKTIRLKEDSLKDCLRVFRRYLLCEKVKTEQAFEYLRYDYRKNRKAEEASKKIPHAWESLVNKGRLVRIIVAKVKEDSNGEHIPEEKDVTEFLQGLRPGNGGKGATTPDSRQENAPCRCKIKGKVTEWGGRGSGIAAYFEVLNYVITKYRRIEELESQAFNKMKGGYHISRRKDQIPKEEQHKKELGQSGIWVNTNLSNDVKIKILSGVSEFYNRVVGKNILDRWGSGAEVEFDIPPSS